MSAQTQDPKSYKKLYYTKAWHRLRRMVFVRDGYRCQRIGCGRICTGARNAPNSAVCDHIVKHNGDTVLFHDVDNLQTLCKSCHDGWKRRVETGNRLQRTDGW